MRSSIAVDDRLQMSLAAAHSREVDVFCKCPQALKGSTNRSPYRYFVTYTLLFFEFFWNADGAASPRGRPYASAPVLYDSEIPRLDNSAAYGSIERRCARTTIGAFSCYRALLGNSVAPIPAHARRAH